MAKIIFLVTQSEMGGAQRYVYEVAKALAGKHEILAAAGEGDGELFKKLKNTRVAPVYLKQLKRTPNPYLIIKAMAEIVRLLKREKPDVLFLCSTTAGLLGSIAARIYRGATPVNLPGCNPGKFRVIYRIGGWAFRDPRPFWKNWLIFWAEKLTASFKDLIIVNSEYDRRIAVEKKIVPPEKILKIYNGIDAESLAFLPKEKARKILITNQPENQKTSYQIIGCVANFYKTKGLEYLIRSFARSGLLGRPDLKLLIIGDGKLRPQLEVQLIKLGLKDRVILAGRIPDAYKYLKAFDIFVFPSLKEGFPWVILEAMAAKIPIIATKVGAVPEILPEKFLIEPSNTEALANKISQMLKHPVVPRPKQEFTLKKMIENTEKLLY